MNAVHQLTPSFAPRDAIGNHILHAQAVLREMGLRSEIYVADAWREVAHLTTPFREMPAAEPGTWLLYHASTGSPIADFLRERPEPTLLDYHNITPASLFGPWEPHVGVELQAARRQLAELAPHTELALADSSYNEEELIALRYRRTAVVPILFETSSFDHDVDPRAVDRLRSGAKGATWLFVSRIAPNKAHHDLIKAFAVYRRVYDQHAHLRIVGTSASHAYLTALEALRSALQLDDAITFAGTVSDADKAAHFAAADVYVSTSDHEGFGVTLLEAMHHGVPVVAYGSTAVPETMGDGGICLPSKEPSTVAAAVHRVLTDASVRAAVVAAGHRRVAAFDLAITRDTFQRAIESVVEAGPS
ncbi:MAG TPA: glycosyltransferase [Acidimicrobiales bacterium]|nr:glycosyltransferase [Acidimicrobiales bacterium]